MEPRILRASQLDAHELDTELDFVFKKNVSQVFENVHGFEPEMRAVLDLIIYSPILYRKSTYGLQLQNLMYRNASKAFVFVRVFGNYLFLRFSQYMRDQNWCDLPPNSLKFKFWRMTQRLIGIWESLSLLQFLLFLYNGRYPTLLERLFKMDLVYEKTEMSRYISFEYMNRELVWQALTQFVASMLPYISFENWRWKKLDKSIPPDACAFCIKEGTNGDVYHPYITNCGHIFCYYCVESRRISNPSLSCPRCGVRITHTESAPMSMMP